MPFLFDWKVIALRAEYTAGIAGKKPVNIANTYNPPRFNNSRKAQQPTGIAPDIRGDNPKHILKPI